MRRRHGELEGVPFPVIQLRRPDTADNATTVYTSRVAAQLRVRTRDEIAALFDGFTLVEPRLVWIPEWRPDSPADVPENPEQFWALVGVARRDA